MELYLYQNDEETGPFPGNQVQAMLADGSLDPDTFAWHEGLSDWTPVRELWQAPLPPPSTVAPAGGPAPTPTARAIPVTVSPTPAPGAAAPATLFQAIPRAFSYPLKGDGPLLLFGATLLFTFLDYVQRLPSIFTIIIAIPAAGYFVACLEGIVTSSAQGEALMPAWPEITNFWEDMLVPYVRFLVLTMLCFAPGALLLILGLLHLGLGAESGTWFSMGIALLIGGSLYFPMAFLAVAMADGLAGLNPMLIFSSMLKIPGQYLVTWGLLLLVPVLQVFVGEVVRRLLPVPVLPTLLKSVVSLYFLTVQMRLLGLLYFFNRRRLNWV